MEFQDVVPAFINQNQFNPIVLQNRYRIIEKAIYYSMYDIACELEIDLNKIKIRGCYDTGKEMGEDGTIKMITGTITNDEIIYIYIFYNAIIYYNNTAPLYYFIYDVIRSLAHEMRHTYQIINNTHEFSNIDDPNYIENYENIDYEVDARDFASKYVEAKTMFITTIFIQCIDNMLRNSNGFFYIDIYHFTNNFILNRYTEFLKICEIMNCTYIEDFKSITIFPVYNDSVNCRFNLDDNYNLSIYSNMHDRLGNATIVDYIVNIIADEILNILIYLNKAVNKDINTSYNRMQFDISRNKLYNEFIVYCIGNIY